MAVNEWQKSVQQKLRSRWPWERLPLPSLGLRVSERKLLLFVVDAFLVNSSLVAALLIFTELLPSLRAVLEVYKWFATLTAVWLGVSAVFDVYNLARAASLGYALRATLPAAALTAAFYSGIPWLTPPIEQRSQAFGFILLAMASVGVWRALYARLFVQPTFQHRALIVGAGRSGRALVRALQAEHHRNGANPFQGTGYILLGFIDDDPAYRHEAIERVPVIGDSQQLVEAARRMRVDEIIISITHAHRIRPELFEAILDCREMGLPITTMPTVYERLTGRVAVEHASRNMEIAAGQTSGPFYRFYGLLKRLMDVMLAFTGLAMLLALSPFVALANAFSSPGPLFFRQERVGYAGRSFVLLKFRSMVPDAEAVQGAQWAQEADARVTPVGRWLRYTHLDELPQVINVLRGEMSIVGPRPERPEFVARLSGDIPFYRARHSVRPGITGWAQIHQNYGDSVASAREKLEYDLYYVKHATPISDALIILRTVSKVFGFQGR